MRSVLCHLRPDRAYLFLLLFLLLMSSPPTMSGSEHRGVDMSLMVSLSAEGVNYILNVNISDQITMSFSTHLTAIVGNVMHVWCTGQRDVNHETVTKQPSFLDPSESLHDTDRVLDSLLGLQSTCAWVRRRKVAIPAQPVLDKNQMKCEHLIPGAIKQMY